MRRFLAMAFCLSLLAVPAEGARVQYAALTFEDGPSGAVTQALLDGLYDRGALATFLLCGYRIQAWPEVTERIFREGHEIGLHGYSHSLMTPMSRRDIAAELMDTQALLSESCRVRLFRPPGGLCSHAVYQVAQARKLAILHWSLDCREFASAEDLAQSIRDGDVVRLKDETREDVEACLYLVDQLQEKGFRFVTVSQLAKLRNQKLHPGKTYARFPKKEEPSPRGEGGSPKG